MAAPATLKILKRHLNQVRVRGFRLLSLLFFFRDIHFPPRVQHRTFKEALVLPSKFHDAVQHRTMNLKS